MKKKLIGLAAILVLAVALTGCTQNQAARYYGGVMNIDIPTGQKFVNATWKDGDIWYITRPMREGEVPETFTMKEDSVMGVIEGTVIFKESK